VGGNSERKERKKKTSTSARQGETKDAKEKNDQRKAKEKGYAIVDLELRNPAKNRERAMHWVISRGPSQCRGGRGEMGSKGNP